MEDDLPYTSPPRKLLRFFLTSRDQWKAKCQRAKATVKRLENRVRFLEKSKAEWKSRARELEKEKAHLKAQAQPGDLPGEASSLLKKNR
jgi:phage shock protein A